MAYYIHFIKNNKIESTNKYENEEDYGSIVADWCSDNYYVKECGNCAYVHTDKNHDNDYNYMEDY